MSHDAADLDELIDLRRRAHAILNRDGWAAEDDYFVAEHNAELVRNAEEYYRTMFHGRVSSWNLRDSHMVETLQALEKHLEAQGGAPKMVVWAHNSHLGDARATDPVCSKSPLNAGVVARAEEDAAATTTEFIYRRMSKEG